MDINSPIEELPKIGPIFQKKFEKLGVKTIGELLYHVPSRYLDYSKLSHINSLQVGETVTIHAKIVSIANVQSRRGLRMQIGSVEDETGKVTVIWFNQPFLIRMLYPGRLVSLSGKVGFFNRKLSLTSPDYEILEDEVDETFHTGRLVPIYPETSGLSSKWIRTKIKFAFENVDISEFLPESLIKKSNLTDFREAVRMVHFPKNTEETEIARKRLAFNELLLMHLKTMYRKGRWKKNKAAHRLNIDKISMNRFIENLPFKLTDSQEKAINEILADLKKDTPMNRLLEGDVGSGKTAVAAAGAFASFVNGCQTVVMAPTQILANQHYNTLKNMFEPFNVRVSLLTSSLKKVELGRTDVFVGTHSLIHSKLNMEKVALIVIDEQHRFGVEQRKHLIRKSGKNNVAPHVLTMTATPIPRTVAMTSYGDLDLSVLTQMPKGRQKVTTWVVPESKRKGAYEWIHSQITAHHSQVFIVCPLIEDSEAETLADVKSVTSEFTNLKSIFKNHKLDLLHGRMKGSEKDEVLMKYKNRKTDILVSTPVVEVGIDIPNATIMLIEASERFGLAQLHQLRGRVGRGSKKSYCLLFTNFRSGDAFKRLKAMEKTFSGFELAEIDLKMRGPGEIFGTRQSGFAELKVASWSNFELIKETQLVAEKISKEPDKHPFLTEQIDKSSEVV